MTSPAWNAAADLAWHQAQALLDDRSTRWVDELAEQLTLTALGRPADLDRSLRAALGRSAEASSPMHAPDTPTTDARARAAARPASQAPSSPDASSSLAGRPMNAGEGRWSGTRPPNSVTPPASGAGRYQSSMASAAFGLQTTSARAPAVHPAAQTGPRPAADLTWAQRRLAADAGAAQADGSGSRPGKDAPARQRPAALGGSPAPHHGGHVASAPSSRADRAWARPGDGEALALLAPSATSSSHVPLGSAGQTRGGARGSTTGLLPGRAQGSSSNPTRLRAAQGIGTAGAATAASSTAAWTPSADTPSDRGVHPAHRAPAPMDLPPPASSRLVSGVPALQHLLQAQLAESQQRQDHAAPDVHPLLAPGPVRAAQASQVALTEQPAAAGTPPATVSDTLPPTDLLADAQLLDRLTEEIEDRLEERWREHAIRHLGYTSGVL